MTICECITYICTCGSAFRDPKPMADEYLEKYKIDEEEGEEAEETLAEEPGSGTLKDKEGAEGVLPGLGDGEDENQRLLQGAPAATTRISTRRSGLASLASTHARVGACPRTHVSYTCLVVVHRSGTSVKGESGTHTHARQ